MVHRCPGDDAFGPVLGAGPSGECYNFDFALVFEESIFSLAPCAIVLPAAALRLYYIWGRKVVVQWQLLRAIKLAIFTMQCIFQLALLGLWGSGHGIVTRTTVASGTLSFLSTAVLLVLSDYDHRLSVRPSALIQAFLISTAVVDLPRIRTQWLLDNNNNTTVASLFTVTFVLRLTLLVTESVQKWKHATIPPDQIPPEMRQGVIGRTLFWWLNPMFLEGYRKNLTMDDLFAIDDGLKGTILYERLLKSWKIGMHPY
ncbi:hypothetical protein B0H66DRAFT_305987 [Apodospora peruviana]|uniref:ABC transporter n=1 Tax=Apodospora peruviana TaxID=516989 RepID=A0AAE0I1P0_9PEZI|nr:hypothetical protein B0H66DRAFT_305987 [Apodospora peruviana]